MRNFFTQVHFCDAIVYFHTNRPQKQDGSQTKWQNDRLPQTFILHSQNVIKAKLKQIFYTKTVRFKVNLSPFRKSLDSIPRVRNMVQ